MDAVEKARWLEAANTRPEERSTPHPATGQPPLVYRGWKIWKWTGWKGAIGVRERNFVNVCPKCGLDVKRGDAVFDVQEVSDGGTAHYDCRSEEDRGPVGQWAATKGEGRDAKFVYASTPARTAAPCATARVAYLPGGRYERGSFFDIDATEAQIQPGYGCPFELLDLLREDALMRLKLVIDAEEDAAEDDRR